MPLACNIDSRGKRLRVRIGLFFFLVGVALMLLWALRTGSHVGWGASIAIELVGGFMIFEGRRGWCVVRAMGISTRV